MLQIESFQECNIYDYVSQYIYLARHTIDLSILVQKMHKEVVQTKLKHEPCTYYNGEPAAGHAE